MKRISSLLPLVCGFAALLLFSGCAEKRPTLHVYIWSDYIEPELISRFEEAHNCRVVMDFYDSNETMYAKLKAGADGYDIIVPSSYMVNIMAEQEMLLPMDHALIPNLKYIDPSYRKFSMDPGMKYSVPYMVGTTGIGYRKDRVEDFEPSWTLFGNPAYAGRMTLLNDMWEVIGAALLTLGYSLNSTDNAQLAEARDLVISWKKNIAKFESDQYKNGLVSAEFVISQGYSGDVMQVMEESEEIVYAVPKEGTSIFSDEMAILRNAPEPELAHAWINFMHEPEIAAANIDFVWYLAPNTGAYALVSDEIKNEPSVMLSEAILAKSEAIRDLGEDNAKYVKIWDEIKSATP
ncbi:MAG: ABC transporter substrate-binding protein [Kiritimatiellia bacterium]